MMMLLSIKSGNEEQHLLQYKDFEMPHHFLVDVDGFTSKVFILRWPMARN
jgi:hypothetical protein